MGLAAAERRALLSRVYGAGTMEFLSGTNALPTSPRILRSAKGAALRMTNWGDGLGGATAVCSQLETRSCLDRHRADFLLYLGRIYHRDGIPGTAIQKTSIRPFAEAFLAANAQDWIDCDPAERRIILVRHPEHAIFHWAIFDAGRRAGASRAALGDDREFFGFLLARGGESLGLGFKLELVRNHPNGLGRSRCSRHRRDYSRKRQRRRGNLRR